MQLVNSDNIQIYNLYLETTHKHMNELVACGADKHSLKYSCYGYEVFIVPTEHFEARHGSRVVTLPVELVLDATCSYIERLLGDINRGLNTEYPKGSISTVKHAGLCMVFDVNIPRVYMKPDEVLMIGYRVSIGYVNARHPKVVEVNITTCMIKPPTRPKCVANSDDEKSYLPHKNIIVLTGDESKVFKPIDRSIKLQDNDYNGITITQVLAHERKPLVDKIIQNDYYPIKRKPAKSSIIDMTPGSADRKILQHFGY